MTKEEDIEKLADDYADNCGYPKSDKEHFETTYWTQHNISQHSFISGYKAALSQNADLQKKVYELERDLMAIQEEPGFRKDDLIDKLRKENELLKEEIKKYQRIFVT